MGARGCIELYQSITRDVMMRGRSRGLERCDNGLEMLASFFSGHLADVMYGVKLKHSANLVETYFAL
jgi:hypothetical protein